VRELPFLTEVFLQGYFASVFALGWKEKTKKKEKTPNTTLPLEINRALLVQELTATIKAHLCLKIYFSFSPMSLVACDIRI